MQRTDNATYFTPDRRDDLRALYDYPADLDKPWIRVNFVSGIDGAVTIDGVSGGLGTGADRAVYTLLRELCDVVVVGAGTARSENYGGVSLDETARVRRVSAGLSPTPPIMVVSAGGHVDPSSRLFTETVVAPILLVGSDADPGALDRLRSAGADITSTETTNVTSADIERALAARGLRRVLCEGGPSLFGQLISDDVVDELCLTTSPLLVGGSSGRIAHSPTAAPTPMYPAHVLTDSDGTVVVRWVRRRPRR
ncbi:pyrimidine reductase family protein [Rhodococcus sp. 27YEA15]|uniref:pyrimidine reductase family protein n=1 Tax=Rhodococcus sp. 27YEA15 TaxID=3156259 RepID=UPI003C7A9604